MLASCCLSRPASSLELTAPSSPHPQALASPTERQRLYRSAYQWTARGPLHSWMSSIRCILQGEYSQRRGSERCLTLPSVRAYVDLHHLRAFLGVGVLASPLSLRPSLESESQKPSTRARGTFCYSTRCKLLRLMQCRLLRSGEPCKCIISLLHGPLHQRRLSQFSSRRIWTHFS